MDREELATVRGGKSGREVVIAHQLAVINAALPRPCRLLEVGCGRGEVAAALGRAGHRVTAIDVALPGDIMAAKNVRFERVGIETFSDPQAFDAVVFTSSLHHVDRLEPALDRAAALLAPGGVLVVDDFDLHAPDEAGALWYFELQEILSVALLYDPARIDGKATQPPVARWHAAHAGHAARNRSAVSGVIDKDRQLHGRMAMVEAIRGRFADVVVSGGPYLFRYIADGLRGPRSSWLAEAIRDAEQRRIDMGAMPAVGVQITARRR